MEKQEIIYDLTLEPSQDQTNMTILKDVPGEIIGEFLKECENANNEKTRNRIKASLMNQYSLTSQQVLIGDKGYFVRIPNFILEAISLSCKEEIGKEVGGKMLYQENEIKKLTKEIEKLTKEIELVEKTLDAYGDSSIWRKIGKALKSLRK